MGDFNTHRADPQAIGASLHCIGSEFSRMAAELREDARQGESKTHFLRALCSRLELASLRLESIITMQTPEQAQRELHRVSRENKELKREKTQ